jgi:acyl carrier protein phosphodiesterase
MNHLAHIHLSRKYPELLIGNLIADFLNYKELKNATGELSNGVKLHMLIDHYTDTHPLVFNYKRLLYPYFGKYSAVLADLLMDHQLAKSWYLYDDRIFDEACTFTYDEILSKLSLVPLPIAIRLENMIKEKWLHSFQFESGILYSLHLLAKRAKFANDFSELIPIYLENMVQFDLIFSEFYPELDAYTQLRASEFRH